MERRIILIITLLALFGCGPSQQEREALQQLSTARGQVDSLSSASIRTFTDLDALKQLAGEIEVNRTVADTLRRINEQTRDSILTQYNSILADLRQIETNAADSLALLLSDSASTYLTRIRTSSNACSLSARRFLGFSIDTQEPSSVRLRSIQVDSLSSISIQLNLTADSLGTISQKLERVQLYLLSDDVATAVESAILEVSAESLAVAAFHDHLVDLLQDASIAISRHRCDVLLGRTRSQEDIGTNIIWYHHVNAPRYTNSRSYICEIALGVRPTGGVIAGWTLGYTDPDWVFLDGVNINIDGDIHTLTFDRYQDVDDYISGGNVSEWVHPVISENRSLLDQMVNAESVVLVFWGRQRSENRQMTSSDLTALREMLELYDLRSYLSTGM